MYQQYYLETNALRQLSGSLSSLSNICFTSGLSMLELISGINEKEFDLRRKVVTNIFQSGIPINWNLLDKITADSFPGCDYIDNTIGELKLICEYLIGSEDLSILTQKIKNQKYNLSYFENLDKHYSEQFITATYNGNISMRDELEKIDGTEYSYIVSPIAKEMIRTLNQQKLFNESMTLWSITNNLADGIELSTMGQNIDRIDLYHRYNGNLNIFISAFSNYVAKKAAKRDVPAKNDFIDLHHLMYLGNNSSVAIVTDDKLIRLENAQTLTIDEFKKLHLGN